MAATLASLCSDVYAITNRPELTTRTALAIKNATLKAHHSGFYPKDLNEGSFGFASEEYIQSLEISTYLPSYRALSWVRKLDVDAGINTDYLDVIDPTQALDQYKITKTNVVYLSGAYLKFRTDVPWQYFTMSAYVHPDVTEAGYSSWVANEYPNIILFESARTIFKSIGKDDESAAMRELVGEAMQELIVSAVQARGY